MKAYNEQEVWKDIPGYENLYQVSDLGNVKSLNFRNTGKESLLKPVLHSTKVFLVNLYKNSSNKKYKVHQLVAMAFLNHVPDGGKLVIDHINSNSFDNNVNNLRIVTQRENLSKERSIRRDLPIGVYKTKSGKFMAIINKKERSIYLGSFKIPEEASIAYQKALNKIKQDELQNN